MNATQTTASLKPSGPVQALTEMTKNLKLWFAVLTFSGTGVIIAVLGFLIKFS